MTPGLGLVLAAAALSAVGILGGVPYAPVATSAVGVAGVLYLAVADYLVVADAGRRRPQSRRLAPDWLAFLASTVLGGGMLSVGVLFAAAVAPALPGWVVVSGFLAVLLAVVLAVD